MWSVGIIGAGASDGYPVAIAFSLAQSNPATYRNAYTDGHTYPHACTND